MKIIIKSNHASKLDWNDILELKIILDLCNKYLKLYIKITIYVC